MSCTEKNWFPSSSGLKSVFKKLFFFVQSTKILSSRRICVEGELIFFLYCTNETKLKNVHLFHLITAFEAVKVERLSTHPSSHQVSQA